MSTVDFWFSLLSAASLPVVYTGVSAAHQYAAADQGSESKKAVPLTRTAHSLALYLPAVCRLSVWSLYQPFANAVVSRVVSNASSARSRSSFVPSLEQCAVLSPAAMFPKSGFGWSPLISVQNNRGPMPNAGSAPPPVHKQAIPHHTNCHIRSHTLMLSLSAKYRNGYDFDVSYPEYIRSPPDESPG